MTQATCVFSAQIAAESHVSEKKVGIQAQESELRVQVEGNQVARFVFKDPVISRPYFCDLKSLQGLQLSRTHPPVPGLDKTDHATMHPGLWLAFGDLCGQDYWRLKAKVRTSRVRVLDTMRADEARFELVNEYLSSTETQVVCTERAQYVVRWLPYGYMIVLQSTFMPHESPLEFGDQEEMGLGIRLATPLAVDSQLGGRILDSSGRRNGAEVWGKTAQWCDYSGPLGGHWCGMTIFSSPTNFRASWTHARDYGFVAVNPFGIQAFTKQAAVPLRVAVGDSLQLGFAVVIHQTEIESGYDPAEAYTTFQELLSKNQ